MIRRCKCGVRLAVHYGVCADAEDGPQMQLELDKARKDERAKIFAAIRDWQGRTLHDFVGTEDLSELLDELEARSQKL